MPSVANRQSPQAKYLEDLRSPPDILSLVVVVRIRHVFKGYAGHLTCIRGTVRCILLSLDKPP